jgi:AbiV family abortive infection protein
MNTEVVQSLDALALNARRLLNDAEAVLTHGSHQTAASLAILAIEEVGKYMQVKWQFDETAKSSGNVARAAKGRRAHQRKQFIVGTFYLADVAVDAVRHAATEILQKLGQPVTEENIQTHVTMLAKAVKDENRDESIQKIIEVVAEKMHESSGGRFVRDAQSGQIDAVKQRGFYVDLDAEGKIVSDPSAMTRDEAEIWLGHARRAVLWPQVDELMRTWVPTICC